MISLSTSPPFLYFKDAFQIFNYLQLFATQPSMSDYNKEAGSASTKLEWVVTALPLPKDKLGSLDFVTVEDTDYLAIRSATARIHPLDKPECAVEIKPMFPIKFDVGGTTWSHSPDVFSGLREFESLLASHRDLKAQDTLNLMTADRTDRSAHTKAFNDSVDALGLVFGTSKASEGLEYMQKMEEIVKEAVGDANLSPEEDRELVNAFNNPDSTDDSASRFECVRRIAQSTGPKFVDAISKLSQTTHSTRSGAVDLAADTQDSKADSQPTEASDDSHPTEAPDS